MVLYNRYLANCYHVSSYVNFKTSEQLSIAKCLTWNSNLKADFKLANIKFIFLRDFSSEL